MDRKGGHIGELVLLAVFGLFIIAYLFDIRNMPLEGKLLPYILTPVTFALLIVCFIIAVVRQRQILASPETADEREGRKKAGRRLYKAMIMGGILFGSIYLTGFYLGSGIMLLLWFLVFRSLTLRGLIITVSTPSVLYVTFEELLEVGLPQGAFFKWLGY